MKNNDFFENTVKTNEISTFPAPNPFLRVSPDRPRPPLFLFGFHGFYVVSKNLLKPMKYEHFHISESILLCCSLHSIQNLSYEKFKKIDQKTYLFENTVKTNEILTCSSARSVPRALPGPPGASWGPFREALGLSGDLPGLSRELPGRPRAPLGSVNASQGPPQR